MKRKRIKKLFIYSALLFVGAVFLSTVFISIVSSKFEGEGLTVSPPIKELVLIPGQKVKHTVKLTNPTENIVRVYPKVMNFRAKGESGEPDFYTAEEGSEKYSLSEWIFLNQTEIALTPEQVVEFNYTIDIPEDAEPGGHYGVIFFANEPPEDKDDSSSKVAIGSMIGSLVLAKVPGDISEQAKLEDFKTDKFFYTNNKVNIISRIRNMGNIHIKPQGEIKVKGLFSKEEILKLNEGSGNVLPESVRKFENKWEPSGKKIGRFTAVASFYYGENGKTIEGKLSFWIIPWWLIILTATLLVLIIVIFIWRRNKKKGPRSPKDKNDKRVKYDGNRVILR